MDKRSSVFWTRYPTLRADAEQLIKRGVYRTVQVSQLFPREPCKLDKLTLKQLENRLAWLERDMMSRSLRRVAVRA
jgi:hypothetical protein